MPLSRLKTETRDAHGRIEAAFDLDRLASCAAYRDTARTCAAFRRMLDAASDPASRDAVVAAANATFRLLMQAWLREDAAVSA